MSFGIESEDRSPTMRIVWLQLGLVAGFLLLTAALFRAQIFEGSYFRALADGNRTIDTVIHAPRGIIFDRNGVALTANLPAFRLSGRTISKDQAIAAEAAGLPAQQVLEIDSARSYVYGKAFAHLLGYISEVEVLELAGQKYRLGDKIGRGGVEQQYEEILSGKDGKELVEVDAVGKRLRTLSTVEAIAGENLILSIDAGLQRDVYSQIEGKRAAVVVTDPQTGAILALSSSPSFDPNVFTDFSLEPATRNSQIKSLLADKSQPLFDRAISGVYPPGSTFKIVTATAGLETGVISEKTTIDDPGILVIGPYKFPNWKYLRDGGTQGVLNVVSAIAKSNDIFFYKAGEAIGIDGLAGWAAKFGLGNTLGIDLPGEAAGTIRTKTDWYLGDTYHLAIGQGDLLVTPLQVNAWTAAIANGEKLCMPHVLAGMTSRTGTTCKDLGISQKTLDLVKQGMIAACSPGGTAYPLFEFKVKSEKLKVACKTGTAEFGDPKGGTHAWLTAFAPVEKPEIAVTVLVEAGGEGSDVAAPVVKKILETWFGR